MQVIDQINGSALFAQSAYSAAVATKDDLGRDITATYLTSHQSLEGYATTAWVDEQGYITEVNIPESATWNDVSTTVQTNSANWGQGGTGGDEEVNSFVYNNSASILEVDTTYQENSASYLTSHQDISNKLDVTAFSTVSGDFLTAAPADMATTGDVADLAQSISETYQVKGDYLTTADSANFYPSNNPSGFITGVDLSDYYKKDETSGKEELSNAFANIPVGDPEVNAYVTNNSASIDGSVNAIQTNSGVWNDVTVYQSNSANYLTAVDFTPYYTTADANTLSSMLSGAIDYVSANAGDEFPVSADEAIQYVQTNSANIDETVTSFQTNSSTYMIEPNLEYNSQGYINGYNGSAVATIDQERQWFTHDDTLCHISNSAQYALGINMSAISADLARMMGVDETVLYSGDGSNLTLTEDAYNFERLRFKVDPGQGLKFIETTPAGTLAFNTSNGYGNAYIKFFRLTYDSNTNKFTVGRTKAIGTTFDSNTTAWTASIDGDISAIKEIRGIHRISGGN